jgi:hypothetical protein
MESPNKKFILILVSFALLIGLIHSLPMIYVRVRLGSEYKGVFPLQSADEEHYDVSIKTAMDGHYYHKNNYLFEGRDNRTGGIPPLVSEKILGFMGKILGLSLSSWVFVMRFLFPTLTFLLWFALFRSLGIPRYQAIFWSFFNLLSPYLLYGWWDIFSRPVFRVLRDHGWKSLWYEQYAIATLPWARMVNPQFSGLFFLPALIFFIRILRGSKPWLWFSLFVLFAYMNFRLYFFFWSCLGALLLGGFILSILYRKPRIFVPLGLVLLLGLIFGFPRILALIVAPGSGIVSRHLIFSPGCLVSIILILFGIWFRKSWKLCSEDNILFFLMPVSVLVCMNQNVITGRIVQPWHYELFITPLLLTIALSIAIDRRDVLNRVCQSLRSRLFQNHRISLVFSLCLFVFLFIGGTILFFYYFKLAPNYKDAMFYIITGAFSILILIVYFRIFLYLVVFSSLPVKRLIHFFCLGLFLVVLFIGLTRQAHISIRMERKARQNQYLAAPFQWLMDKTPQDSVVLASFDVSERIPLYTLNTVYLCKNAFHEWNPSLEDFRDRALNYFILTGYDPSNLLSVLAQWPYGYLFWGFDKLVPEKDLYSFTGDNRVPEDVLNRVMSDFGEKRKSDLTKILGEYRLDYIFYGPEEKKFFKRAPENMPHLSKVYEDSTPVVIYKIK